MDSFSRRTFLRTSGALLGGAALGLSCTPEEPSSQAVPEASWSGFRYAMCNESMQALNWKQQCRLVSAAGYTGIEIAPFTLVREGIRELGAEQRQTMVNVMNQHGLTCAGLHWLLAPPPPGLHITTPDKAVRERTVAYLHDLIDFCGDLGGPVMVFGSPRQRNAGDLTVPEAKKYMAEGLAAVADHARDRDVKILIESLDRSQTDVVNTLAEAVEMVKGIGHPAIQTMFDFHNTPDETASFEELLRTYQEYIYHVHVQEMDGRYLGTGTGAEAYVGAFRTLKELGYDGWISLEVFDFEPGAQRIATESFRVLKQIESQVA